MLLSACGASTAPVEQDAVQKIVEQELGIISGGIENEDAITASQPISSLFVLGPNVALRYSVNPFPPAGVEATGVRPFRAFFADAFRINANISQDFTLSELILTGDVATAKVQSVFNSTRIDSVPPQNTTATKDDFFIFQREGGAWRLVRWDEVPVESPPADQGGGV